ncbi:acyl carrier protein [Mediterranea sp. An20]|uniref:acyl carrier protein n=1 Tax=Mediterranea sp. An20 TaxID=1965586 RepID=UPI000B39CC89|nr:phosphopantetheine-binding protein [Mediterranea sp. An20]OUP07238.1 acyl carrier protein [Mediterranea sp. An20]
MREKIFDIINQIRISKGLSALSALSPKDNLRNDLGLTSFDLAELTVRIEDEFDIDIFEDGIVSTVGEIYEKLEQA